MNKAPEEALLLVVADVEELEDEVGGPVDVVDSVDKGNGLVVVEVVGKGVDGTTVVLVVMDILVVLVVLVGVGVVSLPVVVEKEKERLLLVLQLRLSVLDAAKIGEHTVSCHWVARDYECSAWNLWCFLGQGHQERFQTVIKWASITSSRQLEGELEGGACYPCHASIALNVRRRAIIRMEGHANHASMYFYSRVRIHDLQLA